jgi:hypothetical protein
MSCNPASQLQPTALIMKPLMLAKDEPDCEAGDHVSESNYDDGHHGVYKSSPNRMGDDVDSDNEASNDQHPLQHPLAHHFRASGVKLEAALMEFSEGLNLINKPNSNTNDDNNNTSSSYNSATTSNNDNNNNNTNKGDGANKTPRKLFECDVCNVSSLIAFLFLKIALSLPLRQTREPTALRLFFLLSFHFFCR